MLIGGGDGDRGPPLLLESKDRDTLIEQSATLNHSNRTVTYTFKTVK